MDATHAADAASSCTGPAWRSITPCAGAAQARTFPWPILFVCVNVTKRLKSGLTTKKYDSFCFRSSLPPNKCVRNLVELTGGERVLYPLLSSLSTWNFLAHSEQELDKSPVMILYRVGRNNCRSRQKWMSSENPSGGTWQWIFARSIWAIASIFAKKFPA